MVWAPGSGIQQSKRNRIPDPDPGVQKEPDPDPQHWAYVTKNSHQRSHLKTPQSGMFHSMQGNFFKNKKCQAKTKTKIKNYRYACDAPPPTQAFNEETNHINAEILHAMIEIQVKLTPNLNIFTFPNFHLLSMSNEYSAHLV
jgi:hypothetical protein